MAKGPLYIAFPAEAALPIMSLRASLYNVPYLEHNHTGCRQRYKDGCFTPPLILHVYGIDHHVFGLRQFFVDVDSFSAFPPRQAATEMSPRDLPD